MPACGKGSLAFCLLALKGLAKEELGPECSNFLKVKHFARPEDLASAIHYPGRAPCQYNATAQKLYAPDPKPNIPGASDTSDMACRYGNPHMWGKCGVCCGLRPHFNWIVSTCEETQGAGQFCRGMPKCLIDGSPKINYVAAYQFDGKEFVLVDESSVGELSAEGISGNYAKGTGFEAKKSGFRWKGGDWTTKYAAWRRPGQSPGPRGLTPPALMWVLSAENFYYGAFYMLSQLGLNLEGQGNPTGTNCWNWELDPVEGTAGWKPQGQMPGSVNMLYGTDSAQNSGCMPVVFFSSQANGHGRTFKYPEDFRSYCEANPNATGCHPWSEKISWSGGASSSSRFENLWDEPYVFAIVVDAKGYWSYRWRPTAYSPGPESKKMTTTAPQRNASCDAPENPGCKGLAGNCCPAIDGTMLNCCTAPQRNASCDAPENPGCKGLDGNCCPDIDGLMLDCCRGSVGPEATIPGAGAGGGIKTGWPGLERYRAARRLAARPAPVRDPRGLRTDVPGDVVEAVMLLPSLSNENSCLRSSIETPDWQWGSNALAAMASELGQNGDGAQFEGAQNWWSNFVDTQQNAGYPMSVAGIPASEMRQPSQCRTAPTSTCSCQAAERDVALGGRGRDAGAGEWEEVFV